MKIFIAGSKSIHYLSDDTIQELNKIIHYVDTVLIGDCRGADAAVQEYCIVFYKTGSQASYESFRIISERMLKLEPRNTLFMNNLGAYWQVARKDDRAASKYYKKVLKLNPDDATAKTNMGIIRRNKQKTNKK